jgi:hypothetical protein
MINGFGPYSQTTEYIAAAILATESLPVYQTNSAAGNDLSFALWGLFDPTLLYSYQTGACHTNPSLEGCIDSTDLAAAQHDLTSALTTAASYSNGAAYEATGYNVEIYTATTNGTSPQPDSSRPQEFITVVPMSEAPAPAQLAVELSGLAAIAYFFRRRRATGA